jgi:bacterioferritin
MKPNTPRMKDAMEKARVPSENSKDIVRHLNLVLKNELTGINQYFLHARILKHAGVMKLADHEYKESIDEMRHADKLVERILFLGGLPNLQDLGKLFVGENVEEILRCDLKLEERAHADIRTAITFCESKEDYVSADLLHAIQKNEEEHIEYLQAQLNLLATMGLSAYLQTQI